MIEYCPLCDFNMSTLCYVQVHVAVFEVFKLIRVQAGRFYHIRDNNVFIGRGKGCGESLYLLDGENLPGHPQSDHAQDDGKLKLMACIHFFSR